MPDQPTLSAEQMAEVRAAITHLSTYGDAADTPWTADDISMFDDDEYPECASVAAILNAAPALLALANECERLREIVYGSSMNVRDRYQVADAYAGTATLKTTGRSLKKCRRGCTIQPGDAYVQFSRRISERLCLDCAIRAQVVRES